MRFKLLVVVEEAEDVVLGELAAALQEVEFDGEGEAGDLASKLLHELDGGLHGAAGGEQVVDDHHALAWLNRVEMDLQRIRSVLQVVADMGRWGGELLRLAHGDKT